MTFSIIAIDLENKQIGSAVSSKFTSVGGCVPYFKPGVGLVHSQSYLNPRVAHLILENMSSSMSAEESLEKALIEDEKANQRQFIIADLKNLEFHAYSGSECNSSYNQIISKNYAAAGNFLASKAVIDHMAKTFEQENNLPLAERLLLTLEAGQKAGGDSRGQEAASIEVYSFSYPNQNDFPVNLRVDSEKEPLKKLRLLYETWCSGDRTILSP